MIRLAAVLAFFAAPLSAETILSAEYDGPTDRYAHGVLGDAIGIQARQSRGSQDLGCRLQNVLACLDRSGLGRATSLPLRAHLTRL